MVEVAPDVVVELETLPDLAVDRGQVAPCGLDERYTVPMSISELDLLLVAQVDTAGDFKGGIEQDHGEPVAIRQRGLP